MSPETPNQPHRHNRGRIPLMLERIMDGMDPASLMEDFSEQEKLVLTTRFGLFNGQVDRTLKETAELLGMSDRQVRQIEDEAFEQIRYRAAFARPEYNGDPGED